MIKNFKKIIFSLALIGVGLSTVSCNPLAQFYNQLSLTETSEVPFELVNDKEVKINSLNPNYIFKNKFIKIFEHKTNKESYVNLVNIFQQLPQFFDKVRVTRSRKNPGIFILTNSDYNSPILFSINENRIYFNNMDHFDYLKYITHNPTIKNKKIKIEYKQRHITKNYKYFDLNEYGMNIYEVEKNIFMPFSLFNLLFISPNYLSLYYNSKQMYLLDFLLTEENRLEEINTILDRYNPMKHRQIINERLSVYNHLKFVFDNLYGNRKEFLIKENVKSFEEFFVKSGLKERILSTDPVIYMEAYIEFIHKHINDLHTTVKHASYFNDKDYRISGPDISTKKFLFSSKLSKSNHANKQILESKLKNGRSFHKQGSLEIINGVAFIDISTFSLDTNNTIYDIMQRNMKIVKKRNIKNVVLNISENGGGNVAEMETLAGYLSNEEQYIDRFDNVTQEIIKIGIKTDTNEDSKFDENDGYSDINWHLIVSEYTFSAGNLLTKIAKNNKNVKVIGKQTGGGMYSIMPIILSDGTGLIISSNNGYTSSKLKQGDLKYEYDNIENGVMVHTDYDYADFFNYEKISNEINEGKI
ncbi:S41 family peptidase [Mycoplasma phocimorsus]|uniref:S41 family peptidase n=1 Tax=Mycoplasma phocimorsus TaxID=3045839 RepID=UPI0024BFCD00|nr:S41 family peptidase [Mycoplasma phocimorsus]MDJ1647617.1 S41 family peptidase [Mycoplasma phocimorsus]